MLRLTRELLRPAEPTGTATDLAGLVEAAARTIKRRSVVVLVSDFISEPGWERPLALLGERHEVVAIRLSDPRELELPDAGLIVVEDAETGELLSVDTSDPEFRRRFHDVARQRQSELEDAGPAGGRRPARGVDARTTWSAPWCASSSPGGGGGADVVPLARDAGAAARRALPGAGVPGARAPPGPAGGRAGRAGLRPHGLGPAAPRRRRHVPFAFFLAAIILLLVAFARPETSVSCPAGKGTVILAFDVSNSMRAEDLEPTRIDAAKAAARTFVEQQPSSIEIGVVAFSDGGSGHAAPDQRPTSDVLAAIDRLSPLGATSLGQGIFTSLNAIAGEPITVDPAALEGAVDDIDIGYFGSAAVVLLSDGENTSEPRPAGRGRAGGGGGREDLPDRHRERRGHGRGDRRLQRGHRRSTRSCSTEIASVTDGHLLPGRGRRRRWREVYDPIDLQLSAEAEQTGGHGDRHRHQPAPAGGRRRAVARSGSGRLV